MRFKFNQIALGYASLLILFMMISYHSLAQQNPKFSINSILQSNMVVQQGKPFKIWGKGEAGVEVSATADWNTTIIKQRINAEGEFILEIPVPKAKKGDFRAHTLRVFNGADTIILKELLIGDVWFLSGQSNMQFSLKEDKYAKENLASAGDSGIRLFNAELNFSSTPLSQVKGNWKICSQQTAKDFSAVGYYFGKYLKERIDIPLGLVFSGIGASKVEAFVPEDMLRNNKLLDSVYLQPYLNDPKSKEVINGGFSFEKVTRPFLLYNAMINPFRHLSIKGFCWYQGEGNRTERESYTLATQKLITSWRTNFDQGNLPFYYVQVAPYFWDKEDPTLADYAFFREAQQKISKIKNTAMVVSTDVGEAKDLHPKNKGPLGVRLAKTALRLTYGMDTVQYLGPEFHKLEISGNKVTVLYKKESIRDGLITNDSKAPAYFQLAGEDGKYFEATAKIMGKTIVLSSEKVLSPVAVRYAFTNYPITNLFNVAGIPAVPFRTDNWKE